MCALEFPLEWDGMKSDSSLSWLELPLRQLLSSSLHWRKSMANQIHRCIDGCMLTTWVDLRAPFPDPQSEMLKQWMLGLFLFLPDRIACCSFGRHIGQVKVCICVWLFIVSILLECQSRANHKCGLDFFGQYDGWSLQWCSAIQYQSHFGWMDFRNELWYDVNGVFNCDRAFGLKGW